jgi:hypothetical protein
LLCKVVKKLAAILASRLLAVHKRRKVRREDMTVAEPVKEVPRQLAAIDGPVVLETVDHKRLELVIYIYIYIHGL